MARLPQQLIARVAAWKSSGYELHLLHHRLGGVEQPFIVRALTREEYESLVESISIGSYYPVEEQDLQHWPPELLLQYGTLHYQDILRAGLLWPELSPEWPAGTDAVLARQIVEVSGWQNQMRVLGALERGRQRATSLFGFLETRVLQAFPAVTREQLRDMTMELFFERVAMAEVAAGQQVDLRPWMAPEEFMREQRRAQRAAERAQAEAEAQMDMQAKGDPRLKRAIERARLERAAEETKASLYEDTGRVDFTRDNRGIAGV